ncbi:Geraniol 8-hydroxylase [Apostasia shenzhenica]|uniref:Geraniol 8-hydroxylase n=1 Tax=Apostasia shenzhenica TaxID=1088818 RepID=A0A2I0AY59_9ASPA|nr:Geraniol 8-hydroxylase [Apostasia shenzhenica]
MELIQAVLWPAIIAGVTFLLLAAGRNRSSGDRPLPPGPTPLPVLGNLLELGHSPHRSLAKLSKLYGPVMALKLGQIQTVVISSSTFAGEALQTKDRVLSGRHLPAAIKVLGHHEVSQAWLPPNREWKLLRSLMRTHLSNCQSLDANQRLRRQKVRDLVSYIKGQSNKAVDVGRAAFCTVLNLISTTCFSIDMVDLNSDSSQEFRDLVWGIMEDAGKPNLADFFPVLAAVDPHGCRRRNAAHFRKIFEIFDRIIDRRLEEQGNGEKGDILDALLQHFRDDNPKLSRRIIKSFLLDVFVAGTETSSTTLEWAMAELLRNPAHLEKTRAEIAEAVGFDREVEESDISKLPFLQAVVKETLRLHAPVPLLLPHRAEEETELGGYRVPKHSQVLVNAWAIGRDGRTWENPDEFLPERFAGREVDFRGQHFELLPFGSGRRICPGMQLGLRMVHLMLASLVQSFRWKLPGEMKPAELDLTEKFGVTLALASPLKAVAVPIEHRG